MNVEINHHPTVVEDDCKSLLQILEKENLAGPGVAVAVNDSVVPRAAWADTMLTDGVRITVIQAVCGG